MAATTLSPLLPSQTGHTLNQMPQVFFTISNISNIKLPKCIIDPRPLRGYYWVYHQGYYRVYHWGYYWGTTGVLLGALPGHYQGTTGGTTGYYNVV